MKRNERKFVVLEPTEAGIKAVDSIRHGRAETIDKLFKGYSEEEKQNTLEKLNILIDNLEGGSNNVE